MLTKSKSKKVKAKKNARVDRQFLMNLANSIYNSKNRTFLRLCNGTLQNGPDPTDEGRSMHCGLGELYFAMTGSQPKASAVNEDDVIDLAVALSPLKGLCAKKVREEREKLYAAIKAIKKIGLDTDTESDAVCLLEDRMNEIDGGGISAAERSFRCALYSIPGENDDCGGDEFCSTSDYRERSKRVASKIREAASYLPR